jgi:hypothetical protein
VENQLNQFKIEVKKLLSDSSQNLVQKIDPLKEAREIYERVGNVFENDKVNDVLVEIIKETKEMQKKVPIFMASYFWLYEGAYTFCIDFFCSLLIKNGHDLFDPFNKEYVFSFRDIQSVETATKLKFLKCHDLEIFDRQEDRKLRNKIAHHDFVLDNSGLLKIGGKTVNIIERHKNLLEFIQIVFQIYDYAQKQTVPTNNSSVHATKG